MFKRPGWRLGVVLVFCIVVAIITWWIGSEVFGGDIGSYVLTAIVIGSVLGLFVVNFIKGWQGKDS